MRQYFLVLTSSLAVLLLSASAHSQTKAQRDATQAFSQCREMEQYGDATACWKRWLEKHRDNGSEAEVMVAEDRTTRGTPTPPPKKPEPKEDEEPEAVPVTEPSEEEPPPVEEEPEAVAEPEEPEAPEAPLVIKTDGPDLCASAPDPKSDRFTRSRVVVFAIAKSDALNQDATFKTAEAPRHLNEAFLAHFPSKRFLNVTSTLPGDPGWPSTESLNLDDVKKYAKSKGEGSEDAAFLAKSVGCSEYLVFTTLSKFSAKPGSTPSGVEIDMTAKMAIFKVEGTTAKRLKSFDAEVPSLFDQAEDTAAQTAASSMNSATSSIDSVNQAADNVGQMADAATDAAKAVGDTASAIAEGEVPEAAGIDASSECAEGEECAQAESSPLIEKPSVEGVHERLSSVCLSAAQGQDPEKVKTQLLSCEVRVRGYMLAKSFRESSLKVAGWQLTAPLMRVGEDFGIALGEEEGIGVGSHFYVLDGEGNRVAYFKVVNVGPGGKDGEQAPSEVALRLGEAPENAVLTEHRMIGLGLQIHGAVAYSLGAQDHVFPHALDLNNDGIVEVQGFKIPSLMFGGGGALSYDLSSLLSIPEFAVRAGGDYLLGNGRSTQATQIATELLFEKGFYMGTGLEFYLGLGGTFSLITLKSIPQFNELPLADSDNDLRVPGTQVEMKGSRFGGAAVIGLEWLLSPSLALRFEGNARINLSQEGYESPNPPTSPCPVNDVLVQVDSLQCWGYNTRQDSWQAVGGRVGALVMF